MNFSYLTFFQHLIASLAFFSLIVAFLSLWIHKRVWLWGGFLAISFVFAFYAKLIDLRIFIALIFLAGGYLILATKVHGWLRITALALTVLFSIPLMAHFFPGFHNWKLIESIQISPNAYPYTLYLNYDTPFVGFFPLAFTIPLIHSRFHVRIIVLKSLVLSVLGVLILMALALYLQVVAIDLKFPYSWPIFLIANLFFATLPEEAFFRGCLQREIQEFLPTKWSGVLSIIAVSILFSVIHFSFIKDMKFISLAFIASLIYGTVYHLTRSIESSIFCHYFFNVIHFFCFTYPALKSVTLY